MKETNAEKPIKSFRNVFGTFGLPEVLVAVNSEEFHKFCISNGIQVVNTPPYPYPESNRSAEISVSTVKK